MFRLQRAGERDCREPLKRNTAETAERECRDCRKRCRDSGEQLQSETAERYYRKKLQRKSKYTQESDCREIDSSECRERLQRETA